MPDKTIVQLPETPSLEENSQFPMDSGTQTFKLTGLNLAKGVRNILDANRLWDGGSLNPQASAMLAERNVTKWNALTGTPKSCSHAAYNPFSKRWVYGDFYGDLWYSDDEGETWTQGTEPAGTDKPTWVEVIFCEEFKTFVAFAADKNYADATPDYWIAISTDDGETWSAVTNPAGKGLYAAVWIPEKGRIVAIGSGALTSDADITVYSDDGGVTFTQGECPAGGWRGLTFSPRLQRLVATSFSASGPEGDYVCYSDDYGETFQSVLVPGHVLRRCLWVEPHRRFYAVTDDSLVIYSATGIDDWEESAAFPVEFDAAFAIAYSPELNVIAISGGDGHIAYSFDGETWEVAEDVLPAGAWSRIAWQPNGYRFFCLNTTEFATGTFAFSTPVKKFVA